jgi:hypothetical protein
VNALSRLGGHNWLAVFAASVAGPLVEVNFKRGWKLNLTSKPWASDAMERWPTRPRRVLFARGSWRRVLSFQIESTLVLLVVPLLVGQSPVLGR